MKVSEMIKTYYPNYYKWETYPANKCAIIHKTTEEWGILHNMATSPITIDGVTFKCSETLFQLMKFTSKDVVQDVFRRNNKKWAMHWEKTHRRDDWPKMIIDALKFCLQKILNTDPATESLLLTVARTAMVSLWTILVCMIH